MKVLILVCIIAVAAAVEVDITVACIKETGITQEAYFRKDNTIVSEREEACLTSCMLQKNGNFDANGGIYFRENDMLDGSLEKQIFMKCKEVKGATLCETGYLFYVCTMKNIQAYILSNGNKYRNINV